MKIIQILFLAFIVGCSSHSTKPIQIDQIDEKIFYSEKEISFTIIGKDYEEKTIPAFATIVIYKGMITISNKTGYTRSHEIGLSRDGLISPGDHRYYGPWGYYDSRTNTIIWGGVRYKAKP